MKFWKILVGFIVILAVLAAAFQKPEKVVYASALTNETIKAKEAEIANVKKARDELASGLTDVKNIKQSLEKSKADLDRYIQELDANVAELEAKIAELISLITAKEAEITQKDQELKEAIEVQTAQYEAMKLRIKFMYERGDASVLSLLFGSEGFSDMLNKAENIQKLSEYDRKKLDEYILYSEYVALCKEVLEEEQVSLEDAQKAVEEEQAAVNELIGEKERQIVAVQGDIANKEAAIREYEADIAAQNDTIKALEQIVAAERARLEAEARKYDGGRFAWPTASYSRISEQYGDRIHPILKVPQFHNGLDIAAPTGTSILAAYQGKVIAAAYNGSMGNYIMIDHGDNIYTIYMHASQLFVSAGAEVTRGQTIAAVGSTGRSTGPHLHFSIRVNGAYVSPMGYIS